jgi:hypothetical protein
MDEKIYKLSEAIKKRRPVLAETIDRFGDLSIGEYTSGFKNINCGISKKKIQECNDFVDICSEYTKKLNGSDLAEKVKDRLKNRGDILTANHHGATYCNIQTQGTLLYAISESANSVIPSFAFGDVPLNNSTYPRGINLAGRVKIPLFPDSKKNSLVSFVDSFTKIDIDKALNKAANFLKQKKITEKEYKTIFEILNVYSSENVLSCLSYSEQSAIINNQLWEMCFKNRMYSGLPEMVCFEIEKIVSELLKLDFNNKNSLIYKMLFNEDLRSHLFLELDKKYGCWDMDNLMELLDCSNDKDSHNRRRQLAAGAGTVFFWGVDQKKRRIPLALKSIDNKLFLTGISDSGEEFKLLFTPDHLCDSISSGMLLPSLFTCFTVIAFARGYECYGGFMQVDYLTAMRDGVVAALRKTGIEDWGDIVSGVKTDNYCTGPHYILKKHINDKLYPAGALDLIAGEGLTKENIEFIKNIPLKYTFYQSLPEMYPAVYRKSEREEVLDGITIDDVASVIGEEKFIVID